MLNMRFTSFTKIGDVAAENPYRISYASCVLRKYFEFWKFYAPLLRATDCRLQLFLVKFISNLLR